jgi:hypothetical protein
MKNAMIVLFPVVALAGVLAAQQVEPAGHPPVLPRGHPPLNRTPVAAPTYPEDVATPDAMIRAYYASLSGPKGIARDWDRFQGLFMPGARLVATQPGDAEAPPVTLTVEQFIRLNGKYFEAGGFFEQEIHRITERFGHVSQSFSTYASRLGDPGAEPYSRGVNSFQLISSGGRWWIVSILWDRERAGVVLGPEHLPANAAP